MGAGKWVGAGLWWWLAAGAAAEGGWGVDGVFRGWWAVLGGVALGVPAVGLSVGLLVAFWRAVDGVAGVRPAVVAAERSLTQRCLERPLSQLTLTWAFSITDFVTADVATGAEARGLEAIEAALAALDVFKEVELGWREATHLLKHHPIVLRSDYQLFNFFGWQCASVPPPLAPTPHAPPLDLLCWLSYEALVRAGLGHLGARRPGDPAYATWAELADVTDPWLTLNTAPTAASASVPVPALPALPTLSVLSTAPTADSTPARPAPPSPPVGRAPPSATSYSVAKSAGARRLPTALPPTYPQDPHSLRGASGTSGDTSGSG